MGSPPLSKELTKVDGRNFFVVNRKIKKDYKRLWNKISSLFEENIVLSCLAEEVSYDLTLWVCNCSTGKCRHLKGLPETLGDQCEETDLLAEAPGRCCRVVAGSGLLARVQWGGGKLRPVILNYKCVLWAQLFENLHFSKCYYKLTHSSFH